MTGKIVRVTWFIQKICDFTYNFIKRGESPTTVANLGQIIKARRERMKINQENLAACAGISTKLLSDIECGRANPTFETMDLVAAALGVELEELLQPEQVIDLLPKNDLARYQQMLDRLPPFAQEMVIAGLEGAISQCLQVSKEW